YLAAVESVNAWHADKYWFILRADGKYWPCSACPQLTMLSELGDWKKKLYWWGHMFLLSLKVIQESKKSLDIDPANFGYQPSQDRAYYVGDKVYSVGSVREVGRAILRRLPEEEEIPEDKWHTFGLFLNQLFHPLMTSRYDWEALTNGADDIPLARHFYYKKEALIKGLLKERDYVYSNNGSGNHHHARRPRSYS
nr:hypothetical protein [Gammaproteobacteria bacterium]NIX54474.1 hypothetical protein [candidate division Zixibacteria bacterium]